MNTSDDPRDRPMQERFCTYKGREYRLVYEGSNQYGHRAKLEFLDGPSSFWVPFEKVSGIRKRGA